MGDRGNVFFVDGQDDKGFAGIYMYTHWSGSALPSIVREALRRGRSRWGDSQYLARIMFCELIRESVLDETGYGLSTWIGDNEHLIVRVNDLANRVSFHEPGKERSPGDDGIVAWSYEDYLAASDGDLERVFLLPETGEVTIEQEPVPIAELPAAKAMVKKPAAKPKSPKARPKAAKPAKPAAKPTPKARPKRR